MIRIDCTFCDEPIEIDGAPLPAELHCDACGVTAVVVDPVVTPARILAEAA